MHEVWLIYYRSAEMHGQGWKNILVEVTKKNIRSKHEKWESSDAKQAKEQHQMIQIIAYACCMQKNLPYKLMGEREVR